MRRVLNESATKRCGNCKRPKGEHKRFQGLVVCPRRLTKFHPSQPISAICYTAPSTPLLQSPLLQEIAAASTETDKPLENPLHAATGTYLDAETLDRRSDDLGSTGSDDVAEDISDMISEGSPCQS